MTKPIALFQRPFYFLRHGETEANVARLISGGREVDLTARGREQAREAALVLGAEPISAIYSSPLRRARETAEPIAAALRLPVSIIAELAERGRGALEGTPIGAAAEPALVAAEESFEDFSRRVLAGLATIESGAPLVVAHLGVFRVLCNSLKIVYAEGPVANALPLRFAPLADGAGWSLEALGAPG
jgi:probable phosphoglycerate mutase